METIRLEQVPERIGHNYTPVRVLPLEFIHQEPMCYHRRLTVFHYKGRQCVKCDRIGIYLIEGRDYHGGLHVDLYTEDFHLMTVDHILPKSKGGPHHLNNLQPMCQECNEKKGNKC